MAVINTNLTSLVSQQNLSNSRTALASSMERLSSGLRVNSAKDDAAGQAIGNRIQAQRTGLSQAARNANDGVSLSQTAHGVLDRINDKLQRIRELTVQGLNGTNQTQDSDAIQAEINQNLQEIDRLAETTKYNGIPLMTGQAGKVDLQVGANDGQKLGVDLSPPGFSVEALGLEGLNIAGIDGEVSDRNTLRGRARDIELNNPAATNLDWDLPQPQPLFRHNGSYYVQNGEGSSEFSRVFVSAEHNTSTDKSEVRIYNPRPMHRDTLEVPASSLENLYSLEGLNENDRLIKQDDTYFVEKTLPDGSLQYLKAEFSYEFQDKSVERERSDGSTYMADIYPMSVTVTPSDTAESFSYDEVDLTAEGYHNAIFQDTSDASISEARLVEDENGTLFIASGSGSSERFFHLDGELNEQDVTSRLVFSQGSLSATEQSAADDNEEFSIVTGSFEFGGENYNLDDGELEFPNPGSTLVKSDQNNELLIRTGSVGSYEYYDLQGVTSEQDITLKATEQGFVGADLSAAPETGTPAMDFTSFGNVEFDQDAADFSGMSNLTLVQDTSARGQWVIRGEASDGSFGFYNADLVIQTDTEGQPTSVTAIATDPSPTILGAESQTIEKVSGYSTIFIDPRNVSVEYTDVEGRVFEDVLRENEDGNYYFALPGESAVIGGYKTATLVDLEGTNEVLLRTVNGSSEVVVYYPSNISRGDNLSVVALTDADGENNDGIPQTQLQIRENGEDFRLRVPRNPLAALDRAIGMVDAKRSYLGATENRLASVIEGNQITATNLASAQSRIMDADYAVEVANMTHAQILQQAGTSVLAQANVTPESILALLG